MKSQTVRIRALIVHNQHVLLLRRIKKGRQFYTFPGGHLKEGETDEAGCIREVKEETNLDVTVQKLLYETTNSKGNIVRIYQCKVTDAASDVLPEVKIIGEELDRSTKDNQYHLEWVPVGSFPKKGVKFAGNISIMPDAVR